MLDVFVVVAFQGLCSSHSICPMICPVSFDVVVACCRMVVGVVAVVAVVLVRSIENI